MRTLQSKEILTITGGTSHESKEGKLTANFEIPPHAYTQTLGIMLVLNDKPVAVKEELFPLSFS